MVGSLFTEDPVVALDKIEIIVMRMSDELARGVFKRDGVLLELCAQLCDRENSVGIAD
jgi:hypothetical protein